jgi:hypothetical protein
MSGGGAALSPTRAPTLAPGGARWTWRSMMESARSSHLERLLLAGTPPKLTSLAGWEWSGGNCVKLYGLIGIRRFVKGFYEGPERASGPSPFLQGYNIASPRMADDAPPRCKPTDEAPHRYGFYRVHAPVRGARDSRYENALLLDYGLGGNGLLGPPLRDYLVQVYPDDPDLLLGKAYAAIGPLRLPLNFFVLSRWRAHAFGG